MHTPHSINFSIDFIFRMLINHSIKQVAPRLERNLDLKSPSKEIDLWSQIKNFKIDRNKIMSQGGKREKVKLIINV